MSVQTADAAARAWFYAEICHTCGTSFSIAPIDPDRPETYPPCPVCGQLPLSDEIEPQLCDANQVLRFEGVEGVHATLVEAAREVLRARAG